MPLHELWGKLFPPERRWLFWVVLVSLLIHCSFFFFLRIRKAVPIVTKAPVLQAMALTPWVEQSSTVFNPNDLAWLDWRDPSAAILPRGPLPPLLRQPILSEQGTTNLQNEITGSGKILDSLNLSTELPSIIEQVRNSLTTYHPVPGAVEIETPPQLSGTVVEISGALANRQIKKKTEFPQPEVDRNLRVTVCTLTVDADGFVQNVLVENSCDDPAIDQLAVNELKKWRFAPLANTKADNGFGANIQWGKATVYWHFKGKTAVVPTEGSGT